MILQKMHAFVLFNQDRIRRLIFLVYPLYFLVIIFFGSHFRPVSQPGIIHMIQHPDFAALCMIFLCYCLIKGSGYTENTYQYHVIGILGSLCIAMYIIIMGFFENPPSVGVFLHLGFVVFFVASLLINATNVPKRE